MAERHTIVYVVVIVCALQCITAQITGIKTFVWT